MKQRIKWSEDEIKELKRICDVGWDYYFPGYDWVASLLNDKFGNNRTASSCRYRDHKR